jgi:hypothetical protein
MPGWSGWSALDGSLSGGRPVVEQNADGRLELLAEAPGASGPELAHIWQTAPNGGWDGFASLGAPPAQFLGSPAVGRNPDGRLEAFVRVGLMSTGALWHIWQTAPNGGWSGWDNLGGGIGPHFVDVGQNADGRLEVFAVNTIGEAIHIWQLAPGGGWGAWGGLGSPAGVSLILAVVGANADSRLEVFAVGTDNALWHAWQTAPNGGWSGWDSLGSPAGVHAGEPRVGRNADGRLEVFAVGSNAVWHIAQTAAGAGWGSWDSLGTPPGATFLGAPAVGQNADGRLELFVPDLNGEAWHSWQASPGGSWSSWDSLGGEPTSLAVGANADGRLELFAEARVPTGTHPVWHRWQVVPNGGWSSVEDWEQLSLAGPAHRLYTPAGGDVFVRTQAGLFRSSDSGTTWTAVNLPPSPTLVDIDPTNASVMYAGGSGSLFKTTNGGSSWTPVLATGTRRVIGLAISPADPNLVYAGIGTDLFKLVRSTDAGATWTTLDEPIVGGPCTFAVLILKPHPTTANRVFRTSGCYAGRDVPFGDALRQSTDKGVTWVPLVHPTPLFPSRLVGGAGAQPGRYYLSAHFSAPPGGGKAFRSDDDGASWTPVLTFASGPAIEGLAYHPSTPEHVYAGLTTGVVQSSTDAGATWSQLGSSSLGGVEDLALSLDGAFLFAATASGVWRIPR